MKRYFRICALDFMYLLVIFIINSFYGIIFGHGPIINNLKDSMQLVLFPLFFLMHLSFLVGLWVLNISFFISKVKNYLIFLIGFQSLIGVLIIINVKFSRDDSIFILSFFVYMFYKLFVLKLWNKPERNTLKENIKRYLDICTLDILFFWILLGTYITLVIFFGKDRFNEDLYNPVLILFAIFHLWVFNIFFFIPKLKDTFKVLMSLQIIVAVVAYYSFQTNESIYTLGNGLEMYKLGNSSFFEILKYYISSNINYFIEDITNIESSYTFLLFLFFLLPFMFYKFYVIRKWNKADEVVVL